MCIASPIEGRVEHAVREEASRLLLEPKRDAIFGRARSSHAGRPFVAAAGVRASASRAARNVSVA